MNVNFNSQIQNRQPQFGMAIKATPEALERVTSKLKSVDDWVAFDRFVTRENNNDVAHVLLGVSDKGDLTAQVGAKTFKESVFGNIMKPIKKAVAYAEDIRARHDAVALEADADYVRTVQNKVGNI